MMCLIGILCLALAWLAAPASADPAMIDRAAPPTAEVPTSIAPSAPATAQRSVTVTLKKGDSLLALLQAQRLDRSYCAEVLKSIAGQFNPRLLRIGDRVRLDLATIDSFNLLRAIEIDSRKSGPIPLVLPPSLQQVAMQRHQVSGTVGANLSASLHRAGLPSPLTEEVAAATKYDTDLSSTLKPRSGFAVVYQELRLGSRRLGEATLQQFSLITGDLEHRLYLYQDPDHGKVMVGPNGKGIAWLHLLRPVLNAKLSSPFGWRIHPVFGDRRFHFGIDLATAEGTPVAAAGDGVVVDAGWRGNYGQFIRIRHSAELETTYSHLSKIAANIKPGTRVSAGQVIGAVGETGVATGPHLYYEVLIGGEHVDPLKLPGAIPITLSGRQLQDFRQRIRGLSQS
jgi:murein DD-endopeptidase MepM/ murein hydrolase activator NlpD